MKGFGKWINETIKEKEGMTASKLAGMIKMSRARISQIINETPHSITGALPKVPVETVDKIAQALGQPKEVARQKAGYIPAPAIAEPDKLRLLHFYEELPVEQKETLLAISETLWNRYHQSGPVTEFQGIAVDDLRPAGRSSRTEEENRQLVLPHIEDQFESDPQDSENATPPASHLPDNLTPRRKKK